MSGVAPARTAGTGLVLAVAVASFVFASSLVAVLPAFRFESQFPALLPLFAPAAAAGIGPVLAAARAVAGPWRAVHGPVFLLPYALVLVWGAAVPASPLPWWVALVASVSVAAPFFVIALRERALLGFPAHAEPDASSRRGTVLIGLALLLLVYAVAGPPLIGPVSGALLAVVLAIAALLPSGLARASQTWGTGSWLALLWGALVVWASAVVHGLTSVFAQPWVLAGVMVLAGLPLLAVQSATGRRLG
ncbi:MAG: hypothetical protein QM708_03860 [Propioniciclava sp.]|uniref:hypothetical protein n=1 Tax=Propioniciclava sp. TaxID=2038686 RepID=UPI0039E60986